MRRVLRSSVASSRSRRWLVTATPPQHFTVAYSGIEGSLVHSAALDYFERDPPPSFQPPSSSVAFSSRSTDEGVYERVASGDADAGVVPVEDSVNGSIGSVYRHLLKHKLSIIGEHAHGKEYCLAALPGTARGALRSISTHPQILLQCENYISALDAAAEGGAGPLERVSFGGGSAGAARELAEGRTSPEDGVICSSEAAEKYGLEVIESGVSDDKNIATRYLVIGREQLGEGVGHKASLPVGRRVQHKATLAVALTNEPMSLFKVLACFSLRDINVVKIESQPAAATDMHSTAYRWEYLFIFDVEPTSARVLAQAVEHARQVADSVVNLGTYEANLGPKTRVDGARSRKSFEELLLGN